MSPLQRAIRERLDVLASDLEQLIAQAAVELVSNSLGANGVSRADSPSSRRGRTVSRGGRRSAAAREAIAERILSYVKSNPDVRAEVARAALRLDKPEWIRSTAKLVAAGRLSKRGVKRATTYRVG